MKNATIFIRIIEYRVYGICREYFHRGRSGKRDDKLTGQLKTAKSMQNSSFYFSLLDWWR